MASTLQPGMRFRRGRRRGRVMSEINVTPFVDVMLVLLIVFMVTAPLLTVGVPVDLPKTRAPALGQDREPLSITIRRDGTIFLQKEKVSEDVLVDRLKAIAANGYDQRIFVRGDKDVDYGRVMEVMGLLSAAGFNHIGLVTDVAKPKPSSPYPRADHGANPVRRRSCGGGAAASRHRGRDPVPLAAYDCAARRRHAGGAGRPRHHR